MNSRTSPPEQPNIPPSRLAPWVVVALVVVAGAVIAVRYGARVVPLLDRLS